MTLKEAILRLEPKIDILHDCLGFGRYAEITITSDGHFLRLERDKGNRQARSTLPTLCYEICPFNDVVS